MDDADQGMEASAATIRDRVRRKNAVTLNHQQAIYTEKLRPSVPQGSRVSAQMRPVLRIILPDRRVVLSAVIPAEDQVRIVEPRCRKDMLVFQEGFRS
jgi:hypothetical protein